VHLTLNHQFCSKEQLGRLRSILMEHKGRTPVYLHLGLDGSTASLEFGSSFRVAPGSEFWTKIETWQEGLR
jgi:hypothetical protein